MNTAQNLERRYKAFIDREQPLDFLEGEDMERQAILERLGWKFIRIRGSVFFRDADRAMTAVFNRLGEIGILPERSAPASSHAIDSELIDRVRNRAQELQEEWKIQLETGEVLSN